MPDNKNSFGQTYADKASFANVLCTTKSADGVIGTSAEPIFDSDHTDVVFSSNVSDDITYTADAGTFTFSRAGIYHIVLSANTNQNTANRIQTFTFHLNSASPFYTGLRHINTGYDPVESTHQAVVSISANDVLHIEMATSANTASIKKGTSVIITEITSGHYISHQATDNGENDNIGAFNPWEQDFTGAPASYTTVKNGMTQDTSQGKFQANVAGRYLIMVTNIFLLADQTGGTPTIEMTLKKNNTIFCTRSVVANRFDDPAENTFCLIEDLAAGDYLKAFWDTNDEDDGDSVQVQKGTTFTVYKLDEDVYVNGDTSGYFGYPYASVLSKANTNGSVLAKNPFDEDSYSTDDFETRSASGITFTPADGKFTVDEPGLYVVAFAGVYSLNSGGTVDITIAVNGTTVMTQSGKIANGPDPLDRTATAFLELNKGDYIEVFYDMEAGKPVVCKAGTQISIYRYFGFYKEIQTTIADGLINDDLTIDTFSQGNLSNQHPRNTDQVPFRFGIRGAGSLRGRDTQVASVVNVGDKKS